MIIVVVVVNRVGGILMRSFFVFLSFCFVVPPGVLGGFAGHGCGVGNRTGYGQSQRASPGAMQKAHRL